MNPELQRLLEARHHDPFRLAGPARSTRTARWSSARCSPTPRSVELVEAVRARPAVWGRPISLSGGAPRRRCPARYRLRCHGDSGAGQEAFDPYCFEPAAR